ncbi:hypothetical protein MPTK1_3g01240 [Marchantia polymorpha subsp. ruderalis]
MFRGGTSGEQFLSQASGHPNLLPFPCLVPVQDSMMLLYRFERFLFQHVTGDW